MIIIANWKMNPENSMKAEELFSAVTKEIENMEGVTAVICPPFVFLSSLKPSGAVALGAQDCFWNTTGAFTGEVSPGMLHDAGCRYVILGHSERKNMLGETLEMVNKKIAACLEIGIIPIVCIGEKEKQEENGGELAEQMKTVFQGIEIQDASQIVVVYEPEWAISTHSKGIPAVPEDARNAQEIIREECIVLFGAEKGKNIPILYGGSVNSKNIKDFISKGEFQGALVGSASLDASEFVQLVKNTIL